MIIAPIPQNEISVVRLNPDESCPRRDISRANVPTVTAISSGSFARFGSRLPITDAAIAAQRIRVNGRRMAISIY